MSGPGRPILPAPFVPTAVQCQNISDGPRVKGKENGGRKNERSFIFSLCFGTGLRMVMHKSPICMERYGERPDREKRQTRICWGE